MSEFIIRIGFLAMMSVGIFTAIYILVSIQDKNYRIRKFRRTLHQGDRISCSVGAHQFEAEVRAIPGKDCVQVKDLTYRKIFVVPTANVFPL